VFGVGNQWLPSLPLRPAGVAAVDVGHGLDHFAEGAVGEGGVHEGGHDIRRVEAAPSVAQSRDTSPAGGGGGGEGAAVEGAEESTRGAAALDGGGLGVLELRGEFLDGVAALDLVLVVDGEVFGLDGRGDAGARRGGEEPVEEE